MSEEEIKKVEKKEYEVVEVATETGLVIQTKDGKQISQLDLIVKIANDIDELKKGTIGQ